MIASRFAEQRIAVAFECGVDQLLVVWRQEPRCERQILLFLALHVVPVECRVIGDGRRERGESTIAFERVALERLREQSNLSRPDAMFFLQPVQ